MKIKRDWIAVPPISITTLSSVTPAPVATLATITESTTAAAQVEQTIIVSMPELTRGLILIILAGTVLMAFLLLVLFSAINAKKKVENKAHTANTEEKKVERANEAPDMASIKEMVAQQVAQALQDYKPKAQANVMTEGEESFAVINLGEQETLKLAVQKTADAYILKDKEPPMIQARVTYQKEGLETDKLALTEKKSGLVVEYDPDSIWAYVDLDYHSLTEDGVNDDKLKRFFNFDHIPPSPTAFDVQVVKKARMERRGEDFYLAEKGEVQVTEK